MTRTTLTPGVSGNIAYLNAMYAVGVAGDAPTNSDILITATGIRAEYFLRVKSVTAGVDNAFTFQFTGGAATGTVTQWTLECYERSDQFFTSRTNVAPTFVNYITGAVQAI